MSGDELGPLARGLLDAARDGVGPDAATAARVRAKIALAVTAGAVGTIGAVGAGAGGSATAATVSTVSTVSTVGKLSLLAKLGAALVVASAVGGGGYAVHAQLASRAPVVAEVVAVVRPAMPRAATKIMSPRAASPAVTVDVPAPDPVPEAIEIDPAPSVPAPSAQPHRAVLPPRPAAEPSPAAEAPSAAEVTPPPIAAAPPAAESPMKRANLAREVALVDQAVAALRSGDTYVALARIRIYNKLVPDGQLAEDAAAIEIEALCRLHDASAAERLAAFDARWPGSISRGRAVLACSP